MIDIITHASNLTTTVLWLVLIGYTFAIWFIMGRYHTCENNLSDLTNKLDNLSKQIEDFEQTYNQLSRDQFDKFFSDLRLEVLDILEKLKQEISDQRQILEKTIDKESRKYDNILKTSDRLFEELQKSKQQNAELLQQVNKNSQTKLSKIDNIEIRLNKIEAILQKIQDVEKILSIIGYLNRSDASNSDITGRIKNRLEDLID